MDFKLDDQCLCWIATANLPSWDAYLAATRPFSGLPGHTAHVGSVELVFAPEGRDASPLTADEHSLIRWFVENERVVSQGVKEAIFQEYALAFNLASADDLKDLIGLRTVHIHQIAKNGIPYAGFEFDCTWDPEHGLGVLMHGIRCVELGQGDTAMLLWIAERDSRTD